MTLPTARALAAAGAGALAAAGLARRRRRRRRRISPDAVPGRERPPAAVRILDPDGPPTLDSAGRARSVQAADVAWSPSAVAALWSPGGLERLAGAYWQFLTRRSLGLIRVRYTPTRRRIVLVGRPVVLLAFDPPTYELAGDRGVVRWSIRGGLLLGPGGRSVAGSLRLGLHRIAGSGGRPGPIRVEVAVLDYVPALAGLLGRRVYAATQSRIHVAVTSAFLRSLARFDPERVPDRPPIEG